MNPDTPSKICGSSSPNDILVCGKPEGHPPGECGRWVTR